MAAGDKLCLENASRYCLGQETIKKLLEYLEFFFDKRGNQARMGNERMCIFL